MILPFLQTILKPIFGSFEREEFKKFLRMGLIFTFIIGAYWTLRPLKNATFCSMVGAAELPWAKTLSLILLFPLVMFYTKLLDVYKRDRVFYTLSIVYALLALVFGFAIGSESIGQASCDIIASRTGTLALGTKILGYLWYVFVESYGSLIIALFWAIAADTTKPSSAKQGFYLVTAIGQIGGIFGPYILTKLPRYFGFTTNALAIGACSLIICASMYAMRRFFAKTPSELMVSYHGKNEQEEEKEQEPGFFEGLRLLIKNNYLLCIFGVLSSLEIIITIFDMHFQTLSSMVYSGTALAEYQGLYASSVNTMALIFLLLGVSNITKYLGITVSLCLMPFLFGTAVLGFYTFDSLTFLFFLMIGSKAFTYALNGPAIKQLYIPTTHDVRFKAQAWIETFGSRGAKEAGSIFNFLLGPLQASLGAAAGRLRHVALSSYLGFGIVFVWFFIALFLGRTYKKAVDNNQVVC